MKYRKSAHTRSVNLVLCHFISSKDAYNTAPPLQTLEFRFGFDTISKTTAQWPTIGAAVSPFTIQNRTFSYTHTNQQAHTQARTNIHAHEHGRTHRYTHNHAITHTDTTPHRHTHTSRHSPTPAPTHAHSRTPSNAHKHTRTHTPRHGPPSKANTHAPKHAH